MGGDQASVPQMAQQNVVTQMAPNLTGGTPLATQETPEQKAAEAVRAQQLREQAIEKASALFPKMNKSGSNACADDEEFHVGLCYEKCATLTHGKYGFRQSAWTCCSKPH